MLHEKVEKGGQVSLILYEGVKNHLIDMYDNITRDIPNEELERMST